MPIFEYQGKTYDVADQYIDSFAEEFPDAKTMIDQDGNNYSVKSKYYKDFLNEFSAPRPEIQKAMATTYSVAPEPSEGAEEVNLVDLAKGSGRAKISAPKPSADMIEPMKTDSIRPSAIPMLEVEEKSNAVKDAEREANRVQVAQLSARIKNEMDRRGAELDAIAKQQPQMNIPRGTAGAIYSLDAGRMSDPEMRTLSAAKTSLENAQKIINEADESQKRENNQGLFKGYFKAARRGFGDKLFDVNTWDMGLKDASENLALMKALDAAEEGTLTPSQEALLEAKSVELATNAYFGSYIGRGYKAGATTAESLPFMLEMMINPASATGKGAANRLAKWALNKYGKKGAETAAKVVGRALGDVAGAATMTATTGLARTTADAIDRINRGEDASKAFAKAFAGTTIENYSEMLGAYFAPILTKSGNVTANLLDKIHLGGVNKFVNNVSSTDLALFLKQLEDKTQWSGSLGELGEEIAGGLLNTAIVGDQTLDEVFSKENLTQTFLSVSLMGGFLSAIKTGYYPVFKYSALKNMKDSRLDFEDQFKDDENFTETIQALSSNNPEVANSMLSEMQKSGKYTKEQMEVALQYAMDVQRYNGTIKADESRMTDPEQSPEKKEREQSYDNGYTLTEPQEMNDAKLNLEDAEAKMRQYFGGLEGDESIEAFVGEEPIDKVMDYREKGDKKGSQLILDWMNAKATYDGMTQRISDDMDNMIAESNRIIYKRVNKDDGAIHTVTLKDNRRVDVIKGNIVLTDKGLVDKAKSSESIIIRDQTGKSEFSSPSAILSVEPVQNAEELVKANAEVIRNKVADDAEKKIDGILPFNINDVYEVMDDDGVKHTATVVGLVDDNTVQIMWDNEAQSTTASKDIVQQMSDAYNKYRLAEYNAEKEAQKAENATQPSEEIKAVTEETPANRVVPMQKNGQPDFNAMDAEMFVDEYVNRYGEDSATKLARKNISVAREAIAKIDKKIDDVVDPNQMEALSQQKDAAQAQLDRYIDILGRLGATDNETEAEEKSRLRKDAGNKIAQLFPDGLPNVESFILADIATGNRIRWSDKEVNGAVTSRGLGAELGYTEAERRKRLPLIGKDAMTPEEYAESLRERLDATGIRYDESSLRDAVLSVYQSVDSRKGAWDALEDISRRGQEPEMDTDWEDMQAQMAYNKAQNEIAPALPDMPDLATIEEETPISGEEEAEIETQARAEEQADYDAMMEENPPVIEENAEDNEEVALTTEKRELQNKIQDWLTPENVSWAEGRELSESIEKFGNTLEPIAILPKILNKYFPNVPLYLYSGKGYLIDHAANHHPELAVEEYNKIQEVIDSYDDIKDLSTPNTKKIAFVKMLDKGFAVVTELTEKDGKIMLHKTFFYKDSQGKRVPYKNKPSLLRKSPVDGSTTISPTEETVAGRHRNISALGVSESKDTTSEPKSQEVDKKILQENVVEKKVNTPTKQTYTKVKKLLIEPTKPDYTTVVAPSMVTMEVPMNVYKYVSKDKLNMYSGVYFDKDKYLVATDLFNLVVLKVRDMQRSDADKFVTKQLEKKAEGTFNWRDILVPVDKSIDGVIDFVDIVGKVGKKAKKNEKPKAVRIAYNGESILIPAERLQPLADFQKAVGIGDIRFANIGKDNNIPKIQINTGANVALAVGLDPKVAPYWSVYEYEVGGELTPPTSEKQESAPVEDVTPKSEVPDVIRGDKWNATGEPTKMKFNRKGDNFDGYITVGKKKYGRTTSEGEELEILYEDYGNLENAWNAYERGDVFISPNLAFIVKAILVDRYGDVKDTAEVDDGQQILFRNVYHGSGAEFDKFDHSFIGTGEGNQAFGWGTYVTEVEGIGKQYAKMVSKPRLTFNGEFVNTEGFYNPWRIVADLYEDSRGKLREMRAAADRYSGLVEEDNPKLKALWEDVKQVLSQVRSGDLKMTPARYLYSVDIPDNDGRNYLYWDREVSKEVLGDLQNKLNLPDTYFVSNYPQTGERVYKALSDLLGSDKAASEFLNKNGYVGISYPADQGRAGGARNYVIFNEGDLDIMDNVRFRPAKKKAPETASVQEEHQPTVVSSADGAKILKNIDSTIKEYENKGSHSKTLLGDIAKAIGAKKKGSDSQYATFEAKNGKIFTIRLADHNAHTSTFDNHNEKEGISIVVSAKANNKIDNDGVAHIVEYFYDAIKLRKADGKPLVEILKSIKQSLYSGEYKDTTGIAVRDEVNMQEEVFFRTADSNFTPPFYSNAEYAVKGVKQEKATPEQWLKMIEKNGGLKAGEDKWLGLSDWLKASDKKTLTKQEVLDFIKENQIQIEEVEYAENTQGFEELKKEYDGWLRDGGYDYAWDKLIERYGYDSTVAFDDVGGELVVQYGNTASKLLGGEVSTINNTRLSYTTDGLENKREIALTVPTIESWNESDDIHFGDAGQGRAIAWVRFGETTDSEGKRVLVIDEVQSKRHQEGREKGYRPSNIEQYLKDNGVEVIETGEFYEFHKNGELDKRFSKGLLHNDIKRAKELYVGGYVKSDIPSAPFEKNWAELAMKRMLRYAAENGFDKIAWTTGEQQAERYDISKSVDYIKSEDNNVEETSDGTLIVKNITIYAGDSVHNLFVDTNGVVRGREYDGKKLSDIVGKPLAEKLMEKGDFELEGDGLRIGGEGMKAFYDQMLPSFMNKYGKKWGVKVQDVTLPHLAKPSSVMHSIDVTDAMRESVMQGQPMFRIIEDYKEKFSDLQSEYDALDKNDTEALNEWIDKKLNVIKSYLDYVIQDFNYPVKEYFIVANKQDMRTLFDRCVDASIIEDEVTFDEFEKEINRAEATYVEDLDIIVATVYGLPNNENSIFSTLFHEQTHKVINSVATKQQLSDIWNEAVKNNEPKVSRIIELYGEDPARNGAEYVAYTIERFSYPKRRDNLESYIKNEGTVTLDYFTNNAKKTLPLRNALLENILKFYNDEYRNRKEENTDGELLGRRDKGVGSIEATQSRTGHGQQGADRRGRVLKSATSLASSLGVKLNIIEDVTEIVDSNKESQRKKRGAKAWYDVATDQVYFVVPNATNIADAQQSVLHEVVAHKGLRDVIGRENFDKFLDKVFHNAAPEIRAQIVRLASQNGWNSRVATEEYLASLAEEGFDGRENRTFWQMVRDFFMDMLRDAKIAIGYNINDNDMRYMLWRTYQMQKSKGAMAVAENVAMQQKLGVGNFRTRPAGARQVSEEELIVALAKKNGSYLKAPNGKPTNLSPKQWAQVRTKAFKEWFGDWENDPKNASKVVDENGEPKVVYNGSKVQHYQYDGRLRTKGQSATNSKVSFFTDSKAVAERYGKFVNEVFLNIRNPYEVDYKGAGWQGWSGADDGMQRMSTDSYADLLANGSVDSTLERIIENYGRAEADHLASGSVRNDNIAPDGVIAYEVADPMRSTLYIVRNAEAKDISRNSVTPKGVETFTKLGKASLLFDSQIKSATDNVGAFDSNNDDVRFRATPSSTTPSTGVARQIYDHKLRKHINGKNNVGRIENLDHHIKEAYHDGMTSVKALQDAILQETGNKLHGYEDVYTAENHLSSKNKTQTEAWERDYMRPLKEAILTLINKGASYDEIVDYILAKHGLERNKVFSAKEAGEEWDGTILRDFSGLTELTEDATNFTALAENMVADFEKKYNTSDLWSSINNATKQTLKKAYDSGLMSEETYTKLSGMFKYYVPLRGWAENLAADQYEYMDDSSMKILPAVKKANGRKSRPEDPIATIGSMGESSILQGNRNLMKQRLLNLALNNPTSLLTVGRQWYVKQLDGTWVMDNPVIPEDATAEQVEQIVKEHDAKMKSYGENATKKIQGLKLGLNATQAQKAQHVVQVKRNGMVYDIYVNGNPTAAQAINGFPAEQKTKIRWYERWYKNTLNFMARAFTSLNPAFIFRNLALDLIWAGTAVAIKENSDYAKKYTANIADVMLHASIPQLLWKWRNGTLDESIPMERYFKEFLLNGGETGFTQLNTVEDYKRNIKRFMKRAQNPQSGINLIKRGWDSVWDGVEFLNRSAEDTTRFTVYMTSRQMGRSIVDSVTDAKEITVNFNRKGRGTLGARELGHLYLFFNAAIQSMANFVSLAKNHPLKTTAAVSSFLVSGIAFPLATLVLQSLWGDDDENYWDLPEWVRRNNIVLWVGGNTYLTISLPHEMRPFYGIGELFLSALTGHETWENALKKATTSFAELLPIDFTGNGGNLLINFTPSAVQPIAQVLANEDYFGKPIYRKNDYNEMDPEWTKAYKGTNETLIDATEFLNKITGGNAVKSGTRDLNPAVLEHLAEGYLGGLGKTINKTAKTFAMLWNEDYRSTRNIPVVGGFLTSTDGRKHDNSYSKLMEEYKEVDHLYTGYKKKARMGSEEYATLLDDLMKSPEFRRYQKIKGYKNAIDKYNQLLKREDITDATEEEIKATIAKYKVELLEQLDELDAETEPKSNK